MPYTDGLYYNNSWIRIFEESVDSEELVWHRDKKDRTVEVVSGDGWKFQYDDAVPFELKPGMKIQIEAYSYHRLLKGSTDLVVRISEQS